jgi:RHS repeat-associated protein
LHEIDANGDGTFETSKLTEYLNDPLNITGYSQVLKQTETNNETGEITITSYVIGHQRISQTVEKNGESSEYYFTFDGHGSTRVLTDLAGAVVQLYAFDAFGNALGFDPSTALTEFLYSGEQFDAKIGQQYLRQRYYDPSSGRFNRLDPFFGNMSDPLSLHKYLYTHADPVNGIDPSVQFSVGSVGIGMAIGGMMGASISGGVNYYYNRSLSLAGQAAWRGFVLGVIAGASFPIAAAGIGWTATLLGASRGLSLALSFWGASAISGAIPAYLDSIWEGNHPLSVQSAQHAVFGGVLGLLTAGVFKFTLGRIQAGYGHSIPANEMNEVALQQVMNRVRTLANDERFLQINGLDNHPQAKEIFFELIERQLTPALSNYSGAAVGILNVRQPNGEIKTILSLALPKGASDYTIRHELTHVARQAAHKATNDFDLFLYEHNAIKFDPEYWMVFLREESIAHVQASRLIISGGGL